MFAFPVLMVIIMIGTYIPAMRAPQPQDVPLAVVGASATQMETIDAFQQNAGDTYDIIFLPDAEAARDEVRNRNLSAALVLTPAVADLDQGSAYQQVPPPMVDGETTAAVAYVATAAGSTRASSALLPLQNLALQLDAPLVVRDLVTLEAADSAGIGAMFFAMAVTLAGFISVTTLSSVAPHMLSLKPLLTALTIFGSVVSLWVWFMTHVIVGAVNGPFIPLFITGLLTVIAAGLAAAFFTRLVGPLAILLSLFIFIALGMPASGASVPIEFTPWLYQFGNDILSFAATTGAVTSIMYFDGADLGSNWFALIAWIVVMGGGLELVSRWKARGKEDATGDQPTDLTTPDVVTPV